MGNFFEEVRNLVILAGEDKPCLDTMIRNAIKNAALLGKTEEVFNLKEHKVLTSSEILDLANLVEEGFKVETKLDLSAQSYPSVSVYVSWGDK